MQSLSRVLVPVLAFMLVNQAPFEGSHTMGALTDIQIALGSVRYTYVWRIGERISREIRAPTTSL